MVRILMKIGVAVLFTVFTVASAQAQSTKEEKFTKHTCTDACLNAGKCVLVHGEKGHTCDASCKTASTITELKDHVCTGACHSAGKCVLVHGEKGHTCDAKCKINK